MAPPCFVRAPSMAQPDPTRPSACPSQFVWFGGAVCLDLLLALFTFAPLRAVLAVWTLLRAAPYVDARPPARASTALSPRARHGGMLAGARQRTGRAP